MCAIPVATFFLTFFFCGLPLAGGAPDGVPVFAVDISLSRYFPGRLNPDPNHGVGLRARESTPLRGPLRVRAFVWVRCPLTGSPLR